MAKTNAVGGLGVLNGSVGDVRASILTESQFQEVNGPTWVLMDGRDITGSDLAALTGSNNIPDARGQFLRGKNNGRSDGSQDPGGERALGSFQSDATAPNSLSTVGAGGHGHSLSKSSSNLFGTALNAAGGGSGLCVSWVAHAGVNSGNAVADDVADHIHNFTGDSETRPNNIVVNYFIKIQD